MTKQSISAMFLAFAVASIYSTSLFAAKGEGGDINELGRLQSSLKNKRSKEIDAQAAYSTLDAKLQKALSVASRQAYIDIKSSGVKLEKLMRLYGILKKEIKSLGARNYTGLVMDADQYYARFTVDDYRYYVGAFSPEGSNKIVATYGKLPYSESYGDPAEKCEFHITVDIMYPSVLGTNMKDTSEVFDCAAVLSGKANTAIKNIIIKATSDALKDDKPHY